MSLCNPIELLWHLGCFSNKRLWLLGLLAVGDAVALIAFNHFRSYLVRELPLIQMIKVGVSCWIITGVFFFLE